MARRANKETKKVASVGKKAAKASTSKAAAKKKIVKKAAAPKKKAAQRAAPAKKTKKARPAAKATPKVVKATRKKAAKPSPAARSAKAAKARPSVRKSAKATPRRLPRKPKPSPAEIEGLRIAKERRQAMERQVDFYDKASKAFNARRFQRALSLFEKAADGPESTLSNRARVHLAICQRLTKPRKVKLKTADEFYNYGIQLVNARQFDEAAKSFAHALKRQPRGAHIHFAVAVLSALTRDTAGTYKSLKRAIDLDPRNRVLALNDPDLSAAVHEPAIAQLLHGNSEADTSL